MTDYQLEKLKEFIKNNINLVQNKEYEKIYTLLDDVDEKEISTKDWIAQCFTELMFQIKENPFEGLTEIPAYGAVDLDIEKIDIPNGVKNIRTGAFEGCKKLKNVKLPDSLKRIGSEVFSNCISLEDISIPDSVKMIDIAAFERTGRLVNRF